jgi:hypothetical protein
MARDVRITIDVKIDSPPGMPAGELCEGALQAASAWLGGIMGWRAQKITAAAGGFEAGYTLVPASMPKRDGLTVVGDDPL